jgi:hypothetical protein
VKKRREPRKVVDETVLVRCALGKGILREEVWQDSHGAAVKYNLAFINHSLWAGDNGRVRDMTTATAIAIGITPE